MPIAGGKEGVGMELPCQVVKAMKVLEKAGHESYVVGGCVRDSLLHLRPHDWDICTPARPQEIQDAFEGYPVVVTGQKHGTVTVMMDGMGLEITTYRSDGAYADHRHPDQVRFVASLWEDLSRRDFTINAMAYRPGTGIVDPFHGQEDLRTGCLRCVGEPEKRFCEDALRILRALRFAADYGLTIEADTSAALRRQMKLLTLIAPERIMAEMNRLIVGKGAGKILRQYPEVLAVFLPEISSAIGFEQHSVYHHLSVWEHTALAVESAASVLPVRLALLFHDLAKPQCFTLDKEGCGHFYGHGGRSSLIAEQALIRLRYDRRTVEQVTRLVKYHDTPIEAAEPAVKRWLNRMGEEDFRLLLEVKKGDTLGHAPWVVEAGMERIDRVEQCMEGVLRQRQCFALKDLAVNGVDVLKTGIPAGPKVGQVLRWLLEQVINGGLPNDRAVLLEAVRDGGSQEDRSRES